MKRKVCCFLESWDSGGIEALITNVLTDRDISDLKIDIVAARITKNAYSDRLEKIGIRFIELTGSLRSFKNFSAFRDVLKKEAYDAVHFNIFHGLALGYVKTAESLGVPMRIVHSHGSGLRKSKTRYLKLVLHNICKLIFKKTATHRLACSDKAAKFLYGNIPSIIVKNGINTETFRFSEISRERIRAALGFKDEILVGHIGRLSSEKNHEFALKVFKEYNLINPASHFVSIGDGPLRSMCESQADRLGIKDCVSFIGNQSNTGEWLSAMDIFVFPSIVEGLGIAAIEAQASGLFVLCSESLPPEACVTDRFISLPITDTGVWVEKIRECVKPNSRELYADTVKEAGFDITETANRILTLYRGEEL